MFSSLLPTLGTRAESVLLEGSASIPAAAPAICPLVGARAEVLLRVDATAGAQQTPDSARNLVCPREDSAQNQVRSARGPTQLKQKKRQPTYAV
jgi:hypothetical protein